MSVTIRRPFHWGIVVIVGDDWTEDLPEVEPDHYVSAGERALIVAVRHAQDTNEVEGDFVKFAEAHVVVRRLSETPPSDSSRREVFRGVIQVPTGRLSVGDADEDVVVPAHAGANSVVVSVDADVASDDLSPDAVYVDLLPGPTSA